MRHYSDVLEHPSKLSPEARQWIAEHKRRQMRPFRWLVGIARAGAAAVMRASWGVEVVLVGLVALALAAALSGAA